MKHHLKQVAFVILASCMLVSMGAFAATTLNPGDNLTNAGNILSNADYPQSFDVAQSSNSFTGSFSGNVFSGVSDDDTFNPFGAGKLTFFYQFTNDSSNLDSIVRMSIAGWTGISTSVAWNGDFNNGTRYSGEPPFSINRSVNGNVIGENFDHSTFSDPIAPGNFGNLIVYTNATLYETTNASFIDGGTASATVFTAALIPEPEIYAMMGVGLLLMGFVARRRRQQGLA